MKASSLTQKKWEEKKHHISTAYKDNNKYTVYKREIKKQKNNLYRETIETETFKLVVSVPVIATYDSLLEVYLAIEREHIQQQPKNIYISNFRQN